MIGVAIALAAIAIGNHLASSANKEANELSTAERHPANAVLRPGEAAFIQPGDMRVGSWYSLEFIAGPNLRAINEEAEDLPTTRPRAILVSRDMRVVLLPDRNFQIEPKSKAQQQTGSDLSATWLWDVKPLAQGTHTLIAQVDVLQGRPGGRYTVFNRYSRRVSVRVSVGTLDEVITDIRDAKSVGDALTSLLKSWRATLLALAGFIAAIAVVFWSVHKIRRHARRPRRHASDQESAQSSYE